MVYHSMVTIPYGVLSASVNIKCAGNILIGKCYSIAREIFKYVTYCMSYVIVVSVILEPINLK